MIETCQFAATRYLLVVVERAREFVARRSESESELLSRVEVRK